MRSSRAAPGTVAEVLRPLLAKLFGAALTVRFEFFDGSSLGRHAAASPGTVFITSPNALRRILWAPGELGIARAYVAGEIDVTGDLYGVLAALRRAAPGGLRRPAALVPDTLAAVRRLHLMGPPPPPPAAEIRLASWRRSGSVHSRRRDAAAVTHHYDVGNDFYRIVLGPAMTYSCARFETAEMSLEEAQTSKHELICRKLALPERPAARLLDVGCGWGSMALHAASRHKAEVVGITLSTEQAKLARERVDEAGLGAQVDIRVQDYRDLRGSGEVFDAICSVGMFEHVGESRMAEYFETLHDLLKPAGRLLNHAISRRGGSKMRGPTFMNRYVFPDGELLDVGRVVVAMERAGFEVRDVESLREHYARTLKCWVSNLEASYEEAVRLAGGERARVWRLYMAASANSFEEGRISVHQVLGVHPEAGGRSGMPPTRADWG